MINSTFGGFMTARQGMAASQHGLNLTGHNLTNSATKGYTRQRIDQVSLNFNGSYRYASQYNVNVGNGVLVTGTSQLRDPFLDLRYRNEVAHMGEQGIKLEVLGDLQSILDEVKNAGDDTLGDGGIFNQLGDILAKLQQLSNEVGNKEFDSMVRSSCQALTTLFQSYDKRIQEVETNLSYDLENVDVPQVNDILKSIRELNKTIKSNEIMGDSALELKDQRNLLIDELSNYMKINVLYKPVQVSDSTVVDELTISMVGSDGNKYALVADEQCRELVLTKDGNQSGPGKYNISLSELTPVDTELKAALQSAITQLENAKKAADPATLKQSYTDAAAAYTTASAEWATLTDAVTASTNDFNTKKAAYDAAQAAYDAAKAAKDALGPDATDEEKKAAADKVTETSKARNEAQSAMIKAQNQVATDEAVKNAYKNTYNKAVSGYTDAVNALPSDTAGLEAVFGAGNIPDDLRTEAADQIQGGNGAATNLENAQKAYDAALEDLAISEVNGKVVDCINDLLVDGTLKGTLEMLNYSAEFDNPPNNIRGIGYFHNMLDTLAYEFATKMNAANNPAGVVQKDANGDPIYLKDENGNNILDANGNPTTCYNLFASTNGEKIDASNITIAEGWAKNEYGITASMKVDASSGSNDNILHIISMFGEKFGFKASEDLLGKITFTRPQSSVNTNTTNGMKPGDTITIDGKTYTYVEGATGANGTEFDTANFDTLKTAGEKNGMNITVDPTTKEITATTKDQDLSKLVTVNNDQIKNLTDINVNNLTYGDQITIDGKTFTFKPNAPTDAATGDDITDGIFSDFATLQTEAAAKNIEITGTADNIQSIARTGNVAETVTVSKAPNIKDLKDGDTITIDNGTGTPITLTYADDTEKLIADAAAAGIDMHISDDGEITSATQVGSNLFNGTFEEFFTNIGNVLGLDIQSTTEMLDNYTKLASTIEQNREAVTGVSLDEEAMNIMRYQQSYNASARLMTALDEMLSTLINNTGVAGR